MPAKKSKSLVVVESPAKAKTISRFLGSDYVVEASYGHVRDLPQSAKEIPEKAKGESWARLGVNVEDGFEPLYVVPTQKKKHVQRLRQALKEADRLLLATDEDREGESISWHVLQLLKPRASIDVKRIVFHEVTEEAIRRALESPRAMDENLVRAQEARRILDRLYGYSLSPLLWKRVAPGLSAGRVQSVAVRLMVERERERIAFHPAEYWGLKARLGADGGSFAVRLLRVGETRLAEGRSFDPDSGELKDKTRLHLSEDRARGLAERAAAERPWRVTGLDRTPGEQRPAPPFVTSTLQQEANRKLRFSSRQTMRVAQQLYEGIDLSGDRIGLITYMRTDSVTLAERAVRQAREVISEAYGQEYLPERPTRYRTKAKRAQEAHEAIRPTDLTRRPKDVRPFLDDDQYRLYELVWKRTVACQMVPAQLERSQIEVSAQGESEPLVFAANGRRIVFPGFLRAYVEGSDDPEAELGDQETLLPALELGQDVEPLEVEADGHTTKPPYRFTEASLVKKLEEEGIGRPSTYAPILSTVQERGYVVKRGNELVPTFTAFCVTQLLEKQFLDLVDTRFTAHMEDELDDIAAGKMSRDQLVAAFYYGGGASPGLTDRLRQGGEVEYPAVEIGEDRESGEPLVVKVGKYGPYLRRGDGGRANVVSLPENLAPDELTVELASDLLRGRDGEDPPLVLDEHGRGILLRIGRFGPYLERQRTEQEEAAETKPKRVSLPKGLAPDELTAEIALRLIGLPRTLGSHPDDGEEIQTGLGRYGPYVRHGSDFRSLDSWERACDLQLPEALDILKQPKAPGRGRPKRVIKELGDVADAAGTIKVMDGRYGSYVTDGKTNATLPKGSDPQAVTVEQAAELLRAKRAAAPRRRRS